MKKNKLKIILALTGTLIIGFALGMLTSAQIRNAHIKKYRSFTTQDGFAYWTIHLINPTPEQKEKILPVIRKYAAKNMELRKEYRGAFISLMKDYKKELYPLLTKEQINRLEHMTRSHGRRGSHPGKGPGSGRSPNTPGGLPCETNK
jgi:hypothetical protein